MQCRDAGNVYDVCSPSEQNQVVAHLSGILGCVEVAVSIYNFVNIELHSQGWYALRVRAIPNSGVKAVWPCPIQGSEFFGPDASKKAQNVFSTSKMEEGSSFRTHIFRIKYCYEEAIIGENFCFQVYFASLRDLNLQPLLLEVEMLFMDSNPTNPSAVPDVFHLKPVASERIRLGSAARGAFEFYACTFDCDHFALCNLGVHSTLLGFSTQEALSGAVHNWSGPSLTLGKPSKWLSIRSSRHHSVHGVSTSLSSISVDSGRSNSGMSETSGKLEKLLIRNGLAPSGKQAVQLQAQQQQQQPQHDRSSNGSQTMPGASPMLDDDVAQRSLASALAKALAAGVYVKSGVVAADKLEGPASPEQLQFIKALYDSLVGLQRDNLSTLVHFLKGIPKSCYAPQNYETLHVLILGDSARATAGTCDGVQMFPKVDPGSWPNVHDASVFMARLPAGCSAAEALQLLEASLRRLRQMMWAEWQILMWVLRVSTCDLHRYLKCHWELDQPRLVAPWLSVNTNMSDVEIELAQASNMRLMLRKRMPTDVPKVHQAFFWDNPAEHPILYIDDSLLAPQKSGGKGGAFAEDKSRSDRMGRRGDAVNNNWDNGDFGGSSSSSSGVHVIVFVHGFAGCSTDLSIIKAHISMMYPLVECLCSKANENNTHDSLQDMGQRLAVEVAEHLAPFLRSNRTPLARLSFVGHSIGNLIVRTAMGMKEMQEYIKFLHLYVSISGPHLGNLYLGNTMVEAGVSVLKTIGRGKCLHQLSFTDAANIRDCFLYRLAHQEPGLSAFKHVVLVSSLKDRYVPFHSSRISRVCPAASKDAKRRDAYKEMVAALTNGVGHVRSQGFPAAPPSPVALPTYPSTLTPSSQVDSAPTQPHTPGMAGLPPKAEASASRPPVGPLPPTPFGTGLAASSSATTGTAASRASSVTAVYAFQEEAGSPLPTASKVVDGVSATSPTAAASTAPVAAPAAGGDGGACGGGGSVSTAAAAGTSGAGGAGGGGGGGSVSTDAAAAAAVGGAWGGVNGSSAAAAAAVAVTTAAPPAAAAAATAATALRSPVRNPPSPRAASSPATDCPTPSAPAVSAALDQHIPSATAAPLASRLPPASSLQPSPRASPAATAPMGIPPCPASPALQFSQSSIGSSSNHMPVPATPTPTPTHHTPVSVGAGAGASNAAPTSCNLIRIDVDFELRPKSFSLSKLINNKIGRQAHIEFIENDVLARFLVWGVLRRYKLIQDNDPPHTWV